MFGVGCFWLKTTIIIKDESHPFYLINCTWVWWRCKAKKKKKLKKIKKKWLLKKTDIFKTDNSLFFCQNFNDAKDMDVAQPLWLPGSPKEDLFRAKHAFLAFSAIKRSSFWTAWQPYGLIHIHRWHSIVMNFMVSSPKQPTPNILGGSVC